MKIVFILYGVAFVIFLTIVATLLLNRRLSNKAIIAISAICLVLTIVLGFIWMEKTAKDVSTISIVREVEQIYRVEDISNDYAFKISKLSVLVSYEGLDNVGVMRQHLHDFQMEYLFKPLKNVPLEGNTIIWSYKLRPYRIVRRGSGLTVYGTQDSRNDIYLIVVPNAIADNAKNIVGLDIEPNWTPHPAR